jgi:hypothetical protein
MIHSVLERQSVVRRDFIRRWMQECGVTYDAACGLYRVMTATFEDGVANGQRITIGRLGALVPRWQEPRQVVMGFRRVPERGIIRQRQTYNLDSRIKYSFRIYREWMKTSHLNWYG